MTLAAEPSPANPLFHEFGFPGLVLGVLGTVGGLLLFLWKKDPKDITAARLQIRSSLSAIFRRTVVQAARDLIVELDSRLPYLLSQPRGAATQQSRFAYLATALRGLADRDIEDDGRDGYLEVLKLALCGLITSQVERLLIQLDVDARRAGEAVTNVHGIRIEIDSTTELSLGFVADYASRAKRCERRFLRGRRMAMGAFFAAFLATVLMLPTAFINEAWSYWAALSLGSLFVVACLVGFTFLFVSTGAERWLKDTAEQYKTPDDWHHRLVKETQRES